MDELDADYPAFPTSDHFPGLTKREYFAACAMQGILADESEGEKALYKPEGCAKRAVAFADALIKELAK